MADKKSSSDIKSVLCTDGKTDSPGRGYVVSDSSGNASYARESASNGGEASVNK